jgi:hypothetical protein
VNTTLLHRRRVERFAQLLDEKEGARRHHSRSAVDDELADILDTGNRLADIKTSVVMREARRVAIRAELMRVAETEGIGVTAKRTPKSAVGRAQVGTVVQPYTQRRPFARRVRARGAILVGLGVGALAISGIAAASGGAMPGDPLYGLKRSQEQAQVQLRTTPASKGQYYLSLAGTRLDEAQANTENPAEFRNLLAAMDSDTQNGTMWLLRNAWSNKDSNSIDAITAFHDTQLARIDGLLDEFSSSGPQHSALLRSGAVLWFVQYRAAQISKALTCPGHVTTAAPDRYGPNATCATTTGG